MIGNRRQWRKAPQEFGLRPVLQFQEKLIKATDRLHLAAAVRRRTTWLGLAFALTAAAGFEAVGQLAGPFLVDRGVSAKAIGLFTAASYALFMDLTDTRLGGTQFSAFMAATNGCESGSAWVGGRLVGSANYATAFLALSAVSLLSSPLLKWLAKERARTRQPIQREAGDRLKLRQRTGK